MEIKSKPPVMGAPTLGQITPQERIAELLAENSLLTDALANYEQDDHQVKDENAALRSENASLAKMYANEAHKRNVLQGEWHDLRAQVAALTKDNDDIHELAEHYRVENKRLREAIRCPDSEDGRHEFDFEQMCNICKQWAEEIVEAALEQP